ncbi:hypothetical protein D5018_12730 [Parashewanella curva]|uniref:Uncharacterized protein n=1 Tax=Parashewanella curva TaxID=2338552 RepID=A0A3L8PVI8_9GAMM|nr:hypothetical protein [Parashewanella curva]RLV59351.1 hypothetical protein D5018_12730 [Parashewanella curva]
MSKHLGFFNVNADVDSHELSGFDINDPIKDKHFLIDGFSDSAEFTTTYDAVETDQQSNTRVKRFKLDLNIGNTFAGIKPSLKVKPKSQLEVSNVDGISVPITQILGFASPQHSVSSIPKNQDTVTFVTTVQFCHFYGESNETHDVEISLVKKTGVHQAAVVSQPGVSVTENAVPVEFKGGNGSPLSVFIEGEISFKNVDLSQAVDGYLHRLELHITPLNNASNLPEHAFGYLNRYIVHFDKQNKETLNNILSSMELIKGGVSINLGDFDNNTSTGNQFNFAPMILETVPTQDIPGQYPTSGDYNDAPPISGWYVPNLNMYNIGYGNVQGPLNLSSEAEVNTFNTRNIALQDYLMSQGDSFQNQPIDLNVFGNDRFFMVDSIDVNGRIKLKRMDENANELPTYFDFSHVADGDQVWWGSRVRWVRRPKDGRAKIYEGYFGWHSEDGSYAFLNLNDDEKSLDTLPQKGDVIAMEFAKTVN